MKKKSKRVVNRRAWKPAMLRYTEQPSCRAVIALMRTEWQRIKWLARFER